MGWVWKVICLDNHVATVEVGGLREFFFSNEPERLAQRLTVPSCQASVLPIPVKPDENYSTKELSAVEGLPVKILHSICSYLADMDDLLCFSMCCYRFTELGRQIIMKHPAALLQVAPWAGKHIICESRNGDDGSVGFADKDKGKPFSQHLYYYVDSFVAPHVYYQHSHTLFKHAYRSSTYSPHGMQLLEALLPKYTYLDGADPRLVLRNLTTNEYVCMTDVNEAKGPHSFGLGHVLFLKICSTPDPFIEINSTVHIPPGDWAGHQFDIATIDKVDHTWNDVGRELCQEIRRIFDMEHSHRGRFTVGGPPHERGAVFMAYASRFIDKSGENN
ncbi:hypothetical protein GGI12_003661 [Dipsacomyces acuminosporus]|nr:hypothetical protein GGI12_003661 [Dipsacomyces acuminosporus]